MIKCKKNLVALLLVLCTCLVVGGSCGDGEDGVCYERPNGGYNESLSEENNDSSVKEDDIGGFIGLMITGAAIGESEADDWVLLSSFVALSFIFFFVARKEKNKDGESVKKKKVSGKKK